MKKQTILTIALGISTVIFAYLHFYGKDDALRDQYRIYPSNNRWYLQGDLLNASDTLLVQREVQNYIDSFPNMKAYGFQIGLKTLQHMVNDITTYNSQSTNQDSLFGYRFYTALHAGNDTTDLIAVPVTENGVDVYKIHDWKLVGFEPKMITGFRPCPRLCGSKSFMKLTLP